MSGRQNGHDFDELNKEEGAHKQKTNFPSSFLIINEIIWNNKSIRRDGRPLYRNKIKNKGILRLRDILTLRDYKLKSWDQMKNNGITNAEYFLLMGIYNAIPKDWVNVLRTQSNSSNVTSSNDNADPPDVWPPL